ncbi:MULTISPECIES: alpha/beta hydrolase family protein [unclassified Isoptericola]|uniref:alpha/beta hydrolase family protein n=1 Tax=unclassified Isoptericola TaxID=2623355 RepID=UPI00364A7053
MHAEVLELTDPARPAYGADGPRPVRTHLWRADDAAPLVLVSHGTGGAAQNLHVLIDDLVAAGCSVAAVDHHGNTFLEPYAAESFVRWWDRALDLSRVLDVLDPSGPVGAAGFSIGGYTVAALLGARVDGATFRGLVSGEVPAPPTPERPGIVEELRAAHSEAERAAWVDHAVGSFRDERVSAGYLLCPLGAFVDPGSLATVSRPTAVRWGGADEAVPFETNAKVYAAGIPGADTRELGTDAGHYDFIDGPDGGDPALQAEAAADAVAFFSRALSR